MDIAIGLSAVLGLFLGVALVPPARGAGNDARLDQVAREARQVIAVVEWFYRDHHACPQPTRPAELAALQGELGDGYSVEPRGQFVHLSGIAMAEEWLYYTSPHHPASCTLWRKLGWDPVLIWRRYRDGASWHVDPGDGSPERAFTPKW